MTDMTLFSPDSIRQFTDYALLNAFSVQSKGLSDGKAGLAVALFEVSRLLRDGYIEDRAFELIQEALLGTPARPDFEHGDAGIGFALVYLLQNGFLEADFEDMFGKRLRRIVSAVERILSEKGSVWHFHPLLFFFSLLDRYKAFPDIKALMCRLDSGLESQLTQRMTGGRSLEFSCGLPETLKVFERYLRWKTWDDQAQVDSRLAAGYLALFRSGRIGPDYVTGCYLSVLLHRTLQNILSETADEVCRQGEADLYSPGLTLERHVRVLYLMRRYPQWAGGTYCESLGKDLLTSDLRFQEQILIDKIDPGRWMAGYGSGIARFLLFLVFESERMHGRDVSRFQVLLG